MMTPSHPPLSSWSSHPPPPALGVIMVMVISSPSKIMMMIATTVILIMTMMILITNGFLPSNLSSPEQFWSREGFECGASEGERG